MQSGPAPLSTMFRGLAKCPLCAQLDVRWVNWGDPATIMPLHDFCRYRHLLHMPGCSWSSRLKYLMLCKCTPR